MTSAEVTLPSGFAQDSSYDENEKRPCCEAVSQTCSRISYCDAFGVLYFSFRVIRAYPDEALVL